VAKSVGTHAVSTNVARLLRQERERQGMSMTRLAADAGLSQQMISYVERGLRNPTLDTLLRMADVLEIDLSEIIRRASRR
jgi:transcriptional regulator with XRE-family HTH domain